VNIERDHSILNSVITSKPNITLNKNDQPIIINLVLFNVSFYLLVSLKPNWITIQLLKPIKLKE